MTIDAALNQLLIASPAFAAVGDRVYPKKLPENPVYPAIVYHRISTVREHSHEGSSNLAAVRIQFDIYARTYVAARDAAEGLRSVLDGFRGVVDGVDINGAFNEDEDDGYDDDMQVYWFRQDYRILHNE